MPRLRASGRARRRDFVLRCRGRSGRALAAFALFAGPLILFAPRSAAQVPLLDPGSFTDLKAWRDSVTVDGRRFAVPERWRGRRLGLPDQPPPGDLLTVPPSLCARGREVQLRAEALLAFRAMASLAAADGVKLHIQSGYRSPAEQRELIAQRLAAGRLFDEITRGVAPPGYSEHMLGTTVDLSLGGDYDKNPAYLWLVENAAEYGFRETYPRDSDGLFPWEPWHWRYHGEASEEISPARVAAPHER